MVPPSGSFPSISQPSSSPVLRVERQAGEEEINVSKLVLFFLFEALPASLAMPSAGLAASTGFLLGQITKLYRKPWERGLPPSFPCPEPYLLARHLPDASGVDKDGCRVFASTSSR